MRNFQLEVFFSTWEFQAKYHMTASDVESMTVNQLLDMATGEERDAFTNLKLSYTETWGAPDLRNAIATTYSNLSDQNILCFAGAEEGIYAAMRVLLKKDDHAIVVVPNYQAAETLPLEICEVTGVALHANDDWQLDIDEVAKAIRPNTKMISINVPNNPTGATIRPDRLDALIALCRKHDIYLFSDEVYYLLELDENKRMPQIADVYEKGISLNVMSKAYGFPGLRIGWIASKDKELLQQLERYKHYLSICNSAPSERLALIALNNREEILKKNHRLLRLNLNDFEEFFGDYQYLFEWSVPDGGCIAYPRYIGRGGVEAFCKNLVEEYGVLLLPASIYHSELMQTPTDRFRIGFGRNNKNIKDGLAQFRLYLDKHRTDLSP